MSKKKSHLTEYVRELIGSISVKELSENRELALKICQVMHVISKQVA